MSEAAGSTPAVRSKSPGAVSLKEKHHASNVGLMRVRVLHRLSRLPTRRAAPDEDQSAKTVRLWSAGPRGGRASVARVAEGFSGGGLQSRRREFESHHGLFLKRPGQVGTPRAVPVNVRLLQKERCRHVGSTTTREVDSQKPACREATQGRRGTFAREAGRRLKFPAAPRGTFAPSPRFRPARGA